MIEWVTGIVAAGGWPGVMALMFLENLFPPIPSEVIMPLAGFAAARGQMSLPLALIAGVVGTLLGNAVWYELARAIGADRIRPMVGRYGRWFAVGEDDLRKAEATLAKYGPVALSFGRLLPGIRTLISIPAGLIRIPRPVFYLWTTMGTAVWITFLTMAGYMLEDQYERIEGWLEPLAYVVVGGFIATYVWHIWSTRVRRKP
ncbi:DedA family protein [Falsiroseomonas sp.]|uniref:DedA family protein n=1 Tax=Falsiroseomonas sp. TaxID=2870721 RepID=UPI002723997E|nr:DedA family protein [Falsiroseomonas sp.]MDO9500640.1 DedA family protein [Falsiroseomonas sp.]MDP3415814.1 DedA family protein [Falsiroseomonas sp.]